MVIRWSCRFLFSLFVVATVLVSFSAPLPAAELELRDDAGVIESLELARHLFVGASALPADTEVEVRLLDWNQNVITSQTRLTDASGVLPSERLWARTGISSCDCDVLPQGYPFRDPSEAAVLMGASLKVRIASPAGVELASQDLTIIAETTPSVWVTDHTLCPRSQLDSTDDAFLTTYSPPQQAARIFLVEHRPAWQLGEPLVDVRPGFADGQLLEPTGQSWLAPLWSGVESMPGAYDLVVRWGTSAVPQLQTGDMIQGAPIDDRLPSWPTNGGLLIDDWDCH